MKYFQFNINFFLDIYSPGQDLNHLTNPSWEWRSYVVPTTPQDLERSINKIDIYSNRLPHKYEQYWTAWGYIMQSRTILVLRLIPDKGRSKALPLFIAMWGISNNFLVHLPSWHDELRVCKEKQIKLLLMFQNVIRLEKTSNSESVSLPVWRLEIFCCGDMKKNLIKGRSLESVWSLLKLFAFFLRTVSKFLLLSIFCVTPSSSPGHLYIMSSRTHIDSASVACSTVLSWSC